MQYALLPEHPCKGRSRVKLSICSWPVFVHSIWPRELEACGQAVIRGGIGAMRDAAGADVRSVVARGLHRHAG